MDASRGGSQSQVQWWSLAPGADLGGNATAVGASANVVILGLAERPVGKRDVDSSNLSELMLTAHLLAWAQLAGGSTTSATRDTTSSRSAGVVRWPTPENT